VPILNPERRQWLRSPAGSTVIAELDNTASPLKVRGPSSNLADGTLLELTANGELILARYPHMSNTVARLAAQQSYLDWRGSKKTEAVCGGGSIEQSIGRIESECVA
jgi:hypothetical protein